MCRNQAVSTQVGSKDIPAWLQTPAYMKKFLANLVLFFIISLPLRTVAAVSIDSQLVSTNTNVVSNPTGDIGIFNFEFYVTAIGGDAYLLSKPLLLLWQEPSQNLENPANMSSMGFSMISVPNTLITGTLGNQIFEINEGETISFTFTTSMKTLTETLVTAEIESLLWNDNPSLGYSGQNYIGQYEDVAWRSNQIALHVPEPSALALMLPIGLLAFTRRRR